MRDILGDTALLKAPLALRRSRCVTTGHAAKPVPTLALSNSVRSAPERQPNVPGT